MRSAWTTILCLLAIVAVVGALRAVLDPPELVGSLMTMVPVVAFGLWARNSAERRQS